MDFHRPLRHGLHAVIRRLRVSSKQFAHHIAVIRIVVLQPVTQGEDRREAGHKGRDILVLIELQHPLGQFQGPADIEGVHGRRDDILQILRFLDHGDINRHDHQHIIHDLADIGVGPALGYQLPGDQFFKRTRFLCAGHPFLARHVVVEDAGRDIIYRLVVQERFKTFAFIHTASSLWPPAYSSHASRTHAKCFSSISFGTVQSAPIMTPTWPASSRIRMTSALISSSVPV